jgi:hypothetical protein
MTELEHQDELEHQAKTLAGRLVAHQHRLKQQLHAMTPDTPPGQIKAVLDHHMMLGEAVEVVYGILNEALNPEESCHTLKHAVEAFEEISEAALF